MCSGQTPVKILTNVSSSPVCTRYFGALAQGKVLPVREPTPQMANPGMDLTPEILSAMHLKVMRRHTPTLSRPQITVKVNASLQLLVVSSPFILDAQARYDQ